MFYGSAATPTPIDATFQGGQFVGSNIRLTISREGGQTRIFGSIQDRSSASRSGRRSPRLLQLQRRHPVRRRPT